MTESSPIIGMPCRMDPGTDIQYLSRQYMDAIQAAGGIPVIVPLLENPQAIREIAKRLDGVLLTGSSSDVNPQRYGVARESGCGPIQPLRDETDFVLLDVVFKHKKPLLGICFGMQSLNVFLGGSLIQDIATSIQTNILHDNAASEGRPSHEVEIAPSSVLGKLAGGTRSMVNSTHHQAVNRIGSGLEPIAKAPDGVIEAVSGNFRDHFILAVQWHPEKCYSYDAFSRSIFDHFVARCQGDGSR